MQGYLDEANVLGVAAEALPAAHEPILPDQPMGVSTDPAAKCKCIQSYHSIHCMTNILGAARLYHRKIIHFTDNLEQNTSPAKTVASLCCIALANHCTINTVGTARLSVKNHSFLHNLEQNTSLGKQLPLFVA